MRFSIIRAALCAFVPTLSGCITITDPNDSGHTGCTTWYNSIWQNKVNLTLDHSDARSCPITLQYNQQGSTGGKVYDNNAVYGQPSSLNTINLNVQAFDYTIGSGHDCVFSLGFSQSDSFAWTFIQSTNSYRWEAEAYPSYNAGDNPDSACFNVDLWDNLDDARAVITITYNGEQV